MNLITLKGVLLMAVNWKKKYQELQQTVENDRKIIEQQAQQIQELDQIIEGFQEIENNPEKYSVLTGLNQAQEKARHYKELFENEQKKYNEILNTKWENREAIEKALKKKKENKEQRVKEYQEKIKKILKENKEIKTKEVIEKLGINNKTFYNLKLNEFAKSVK